MIELDDAKTLFSFDKDLEPVLKVPSGETVRIRTKDCFGNQLQGPEDQLSEIDWEAINPATGPIYVEGAVAGGTLKVHIDNIELDAQTSSCTGKDEGVCGDRFSDWATHFCKVEDGKVVWDERLSIPLAPMIGVIGVAPVGEPVNCGTPGKHGGNMDSKMLTAGSRVYLPVQVEGALLQMGDIHAVMGDCELCGTGLEIGGVITVRVSVLKGRKLDWPVIETADAWHVVSARKDYTSALIDASVQMQELVCAAYGLDPTDAYLYLSLEGDVCINQGCQPCPVEIVLRISVPKRADKPLL